MSSLGKPLGLRRPAGGVADGSGAQFLSVAERRESGPRGALDKG